MMSSSEVELRRSDLGCYKALNRSDFGDYVTQITKKIHGVAAFRSVFAMQVVAAVNYKTKYSKRAVKQLQYEKVAKSTAPANLALCLGVSSAIYEEVEKALGMPHEVVVNLACEKTRDKKKKDLFPLGGTMFHLGPNGYEMGNIVRMKANLSNQMLRKAADSCKDVVIGLERFLEGGKTSEDTKILFVGENLDLTAMYYEKIRHALGRKDPFNEKSKAIWKAFVEACCLVQPTFAQLSNRKSKSLQFKNFDSFLEEMPVCTGNNEPVTLVSVRRNDEVDIDYSSGDNQMHASSFIYPFAKTGAKMALAAKVMECFRVDKSFLDEHKNIQNSLESWLGGQKGVDDWLKTKRTALDLVSLAKEKKTSIDDDNYIKAVGKMTTVLANERNVQTWNKAEKELLLEMKVEVDATFTGSSICKDQVEGTPDYYRNQRKGYLDQFCCIDETCFIDMMLASKNEQELRKQVKPFSKDMNMRRRWQHLAFDQVTHNPHPSMLVIPTKSKEEMKKFLELLKSFSEELEKNCRPNNNSGVEVVGINDDAAEEYVEI